MVRPRTSPAVALVVPFVTALALVGNLYAGVGAPFAVPDTLRVEATAVEATAPLPAAAPAVREPASQAPAKPTVTAAVTASPPAPTPSVEPGQAPPAAWSAEVGVRSPESEQTRGTEDGAVDEQIEPAEQELPPPIVASDVRVESVGPFSAVVSFTTDNPVAGTVGFGWSAPVSYVSGAMGTEHRLELRGLVPGRLYVAEVASHTGEPKPRVAFSTSPRPLTPEARIADGRLELDGQPFFPVAAYGACAWTLDNPLAAGVNVFQWERSCGAVEAEIRSSIDTLAGRAYWTLPWADRSLAGEGMIGFTQTDEPDGLGLMPSALPDVAEAGKVTFMTMTQHFAPGTGALPWQYPGYYEALAQKADILGVDFYPLQGLCRPDKLALNHDVQVELVKLGGGKPTFQWIEAAWMNCPERLDAAITPETLRAEMLLAIAGGANGLGIFPARLDAAAAVAVRATLDTIEQSWPTLGTPRIPIEIGGDGATQVRASARQSGGSLMIVVANSDPTRPASATLRVPGLEGRPVASVDRLALAATEGDLVRVELAPLEAHILVAAPPSP